MAKKTYEANWADKSITVHSIKVLQDLDSPGLKSIKVNVESLQSQAKQFDLEQANYWSDLASDGVITPYEKKILLKQYEEIKQSYVALLNQATSQSLQGTTYFLDYQTVYNELRTYLYTTLALFDDMEINTIISDREAFNSYFSAYYYDEKFVTIALTTGIMGNLGFRVLSSLSESGTEGEIGLYHGVIYQYTNGTWVAVGLEGYVGTRNSLPTATLNQYFLASEDFTSDEQLYVNDEPLYVNNEALYVTCFFEEGYIYVCDEDGAWQKITDTGDYRYVVAMVDLISITGQLPGAFQEAIDAGDAAVTASLTASFTASLEEEIAARQGQYTVINNQLVLITDDLASQLARIEQLSSDLNGKISHLPVYLGPATSAPSGAQEGDYFVYTGTESGSWHNSGVYIYQSGSWNYLDPASANNYYMYCLDDILACNNTTSGYFAYIFATAFWAHSITTEKLSTRVLYLQSGGYIRSDNIHYVAGTSGLQIDYDGNIDANGNTHIGGTCTIDGDTTIGGTLDVNGTARFAGTTTIGGDAKITGEINATSGTFTGTQTVYSLFRLNGYSYSSGLRFTAPRSLLLSTNNDIPGAFIRINHINLSDFLSGRVDNINDKISRFGISGSEFWERIDGRLFVTFMNSGQVVNYSGEIRYLKYVMMNGELRDDIIIVYATDPVYATVFMLVLVLNDDSSITATLYIEEPNSSGDYAYNTTHTEVSGNLSSWQFHICKL